MTSEDRLVASVDDLVHTFRSAITALVPAAERAELTWDDVMNQHPDWEKLQACLFDVFVNKPIMADRGRVKGEFPLARYDIDLDDYSMSSWIACRTDLSKELVFVRLLSRKEPFDTVEGVVVDLAAYKMQHRVEVPLSNIEFSYVRHVPGGRVEHVHDIAAIE